MQPQHRLISRGLEKIKLETTEQVGFVGHEALFGLAASFGKVSGKHLQRILLWFAIGLDRASSQLLQCNLQYCTQSANANVTQKAGGNFKSRLDFFSLQFACYSTCRAARVTFTQKIKSFVFQAQLTVVIMFHNQIFNDKNLQSGHHNKNDGIQY